MTELTPEQLEEQQVKEDIIKQHERLVKFFANLHNMHRDGPRPVRRNKILPSGLTSKGKTKRLRNKYRRKGNIKTLVLSK